MSEQKWHEITLDDLREMPQAEQKRCRVRIGDVTRDVFDADDPEVVYTVHGGRTQNWADYELDHWGAVIEAPAPPSRPLPTHEGAVIRLVSDFYIVTYVFLDGSWWEPGNDESTATEDVQAHADKYGWVELVPAVGPDAEDGRSAGIREVEAYLRAHRFFYTAANIRGVFPEAFRDAVNPKENDDE